MVTAGGNVRRRQRNLYAGESEATAAWKMAVAIDGRKGSGGGRMSGGGNKIEMVVQVAAGKRVAAGAVAQRCGAK